MPFVFVHGVNTRKNAVYEKEAGIRDGFLKDYVGPALGIAKGSQVFAPYWGDHGVKFRKGLAVIPTGAEETFGGADPATLPPGVAALTGQAGATAEDRIKALAQSAPAKFIDALFDSAMVEADKDDVRSVAQAYAAAQAALAADGGAHWLQVDSTQKMADAIYKKVTASGQETFGAGNLWDILKEGAGRLTNSVGDLISHAAVKALRRPLTNTVATFLGDAFIYLNEREGGAALGPIATLVADDLRKAAKVAEDKGEPLVVICHSFGGEIVYDLLTHYLKDDGLRVDTWVTVGSQVGLFEEMSLYLASDPGAPPEAVAMPASVQRWLNVVDTTDVLAFTVAPVFTGGAQLADFKYDTGMAFTGAHSGYWQWPSFYRRLLARLKEVG